MNMQENEFQFILATQITNIDNGWIGVKTNDILEAISYLKEFYIKNV